MIRWYFMPRVAVAANKYRPRYFGHPVDNPDGIMANRANCDHASQQWGVTIAEVTEEQHEFLAKQSDVFCFPEKAGDVLSKEELGLLAGLLKQAKLPGDWLTEKLTCEEVIRTICAMLVRTWELLGILSHDRQKVASFEPTARYDSLPVSIRGAIMVAKDAETSPNTTFGDVLKDLGSTWDKPIQIGPVVLKVPDGLTSDR